MKIVHNYPLVLFPFSPKMFVMNSSKSTPLDHLLCQLPIKLLIGKVSNANVLRLCSTYHFFQLFGHIVFSNFFFFSIELKIRESSFGDHLFGSIDIETLFSYLRTFFPRFVPASPWWISPKYQFKIGWKNHVPSYLGRRKTSNIWNSPNVFMFTQ